MSGWLLELQEYEEEVPLRRQRATPTHFSIFRRVGREKSDRSADASGA